MSAVAGIVEFDVQFPGGRVSVPDLMAASGLSRAEIAAITHCESFPVLEEYEQAWELAAEAARNVLKRADVAPDRIGQLIYAGSGHWDQPIWSPAAKVADELGITRAHCFEVTNGCNGPMTAVRIGLDAIALGRTEYALVLLGDRLSGMIDHRDPDSKALFNFGDAGAAVLLGPEPTFTHLHTAMRTDPAWADYYSGEYTEDGVIMRRRGRRKGLADAYVTNFAALTSETLAALGRTAADVAYFLINHSDRGMHERVLTTLGIPPERSVFNYDRLAHMGGADPLIALQDLLTAHRLRGGDVILLATSGRGFTWAITALRYQPRR